MKNTKSLQMRLNYFDQKQINYRHSGKHSLMIGFKRNILWLLKYNLFESHFQQPKIITKKQLNFDRKRLMFSLNIHNYCNKKKIITLNLQMTKSKQTNNFEISKKETNLLNKISMKRLLKSLRQKLKKHTQTLRLQGDNLMINSKSKHRSSNKRKSFFLKEKGFWHITTTKFRSKFMT